MNGTAGKFNKRHLIWIVPLALLAAVILAFLIYAQSYYRADAEALAALRSGGAVTVSQTDYGFYFDGPSEDDVLVFYPGAKVEETAYAPLLRALAEAGMDVCLVKMPFRFAFFGINRAGAVLERTDHERRYVGGHSLGGAMAAEYAAKHPGDADGMILLGAYSAAEPPDDILEIVIYGSEDGVLNKDLVAKGRTMAPARYVEHVIAGGNHAQFGSYGAQSGDGAASVTPEEQRAETVRVIMETLGSGA